MSNTVKLYKFHCCDVIGLAYSTCFGKRTKAGRASWATRALFNWHQRFIDNCIQQCRNLAAVCMVLLLLLQGQEVYNRPWVFS